MQTEGRPHSEGGKMEKVFTKEQMVQSTYRMKKRDDVMIMQAARLEGDSRSEFVQQSRSNRGRIFPFDIHPSRSQVLNINSPAGFAREL